MRSVQVSNRNGSNAALLRYPSIQFADVGDIVGGQPFPEIIGIIGRKMYDVPIVQQDGNIIGIGNKLVQFLCSILKARIALRGFHIFLSKQFLFFPTSAKKEAQATTYRTEVLG